MVPGTSTFLKNLRSQERRFFMRVRLRYTTGILEPSSNLPKAKIALYLEMVFIAPDGKLPFRKVNG